jgi:hypothetical protein
MGTVPPFSTERSKHDLTTYIGRVKDNLDMVNNTALHFEQFCLRCPQCSFPRLPPQVDLTNNFISQEELSRSQSLINEFKELRPAANQGVYALPSGTVSDADLWRARKVVQANLHPDTG